MRRQVSFVLFLLCFALAAAAEQPAHDALTGKLYLLRSEVLANNLNFPISRQGVYSYDAAARQLTRMAPFAFITDGLYGNQVSLGATADRFIVQGTDYYEYDLASGRLLRRYRGLAESLGLMRFHGAAVTEEQSGALGLKAGIYGFPDCMPAIDDQMGCSGPAISQLPGQPDPFGSLSRLLLRKSMSPEATGLESVMPLPAPEGRRHGGSAFMAFDPAQRRFLLWHGVSDPNPTTVVQQLASVPIGSDQETVLRELTWQASTPDSDRWHAEQFTFHPFLRSFFIKLVSGAGAWRFLKWPEDLSSEEVIFSGTGNNANIGPMASLIENLPAAYTQVVPLVQHADNVNAHWRSELWLFNPSEEIMNVTIRRVARQNRAATYTLAPRASIELPDVLKQLGGGAASSGGDGVESDALVITSSYRWGAQLSAYSRTDTVSQRPDDHGGRIGFSVPAVPGVVGYSTHTPLFQYAFDTGGSQVSLILDKRNPDQFRHSIGVVNDSDQPLEVRLRYAEASSLPYNDSYLSDKRFSAAPHSVTTQEVESLYPAQFATDRPPRIWLSADRPAPIWMSMTDTRSGDVTFVPYSLFALRADPSTEIAVPAVGGGLGFPTPAPSSGRRRAVSTTGSATNPWHTDLYGFFLTVDGNEENQQPLTSFDPDTQQCAASTRRLSGLVSWNRPTEGVDPFWKSIFPDVAAQFSCSGSGALRLRGASWMAGYSRSYLTRADGGTVGDILPFYPTDGWPVQHFSGVKCDSTVQATIGLYNGAAYPVTNRLLLYDATGQPLGQKEIVLPSRGSAQVKLDELTTSCSAPGPYGLSVIPLDKPEQPGRSWAYVSVLDNATGDPTILW
jgi:hypothetical protein